MLSDEMLDRINVRMADTHVDSMVVYEPGYEECKWRLYPRWRETRVLRQHPGILRYSVDGREVTKREFDALLAEYGNLAIAVHGQKMANARFLAWQTGEETKDAER